MTSLTLDDPPGLVSILGMHGVCVATGNIVSVLNILSAGQSDARRRDPSKVHDLDSPSTSVHSCGISHLILL